MAGLFFALEPQSAPWGTAPQIHIDEERIRAGMLGDRDHLLRHFLHRAPVIIAALDAGLDIAIGVCARLAFPRVLDTRGFYC